MTHTNSAPWRRQLLLSSAAIAMLAGPAIAQDSNVFQMLGRLIFGAGTAKVAIDTPQAVTAIEQGDLDRAQPNSIRDVLKSTPGVRATGASTRPLGQAINIRGIGNAEQTASESRIAVTVDGAPKFYESYRMGSFLSDIDLYKRVEVLRGPASSTLYGAGAIGGAVAFTTKDPADFIGEGGETGALRLSFGTQTNGGTKKLSATWAQRFGDLDVLAAINNSTGGTKVDGSGTAIKGSDHAANSALLKGVWRMGEGQSLTFSAARTNTKMNDALVAQTGDLSITAGGVASLSTTFGTNDVDATDDTIALTYRDAAPDSAFRDLTVQLSHSASTVAKTDMSNGAMCAVGTFQVLCPSTYSYGTTALKIENTSEFGGGAWNNFLTMGVQLSHQDRRGTSSKGAIGFHPEGTDQKLAAYVQGEFIWNDKLTLTPGVRLDFGARTPTPDATPFGASAVQSRAISPKIAAIYKVTPEFSVFGSLAHTERMPTLDELNSYTISGAAKRAASPNLANEKADTTELGFSYAKDGLLGPDDKLMIKATAFENTITDKIITRPTSPANIGLSYFRNLDAAVIKGTELEAAYDTESWFAQVAYSNVDARDKATGLTLPDTPAQQTALTLGVKLPAQDLVFGWRGQFNSAITTSSLATSAAAYEVHDLFMTFSPQTGFLAGFDINVALENVANTKYRDNLALDYGEGMNGKLTIAKSFKW